ncbi:hypothetical protein J4419_06185 [Candidatus Woesearchaeota archaeon]|nr:hypothetical protein [Candidatus Woesearchaeota archaeon]
MRRRIIKQGKDSYTLTLPKEWISKYNLGPLREVEVRQIRGDLIIAAPLKSVPKIIEADVSSLGEGATRRYLKVLFKVGYTDIVIHFAVLHNS